MKKILGLAFAGAMLIACGSSNKSTTGMQDTTAANATTAPAVTGNTAPQGDPNNYPQSDTNSGVQQPQQPQQSPEPLPSSPTP